MEFNSFRKQILLFSPLILALILVFIIIGDLKSPATSIDQCQLLSFGPDVMPYKKSRNLLYANGKKNTHDIALECDHRGIVVLNDFQPFEHPITVGTPVKLTQKVYHYLPDIWRLNLGDASVE